MTYNISKPNKNIFGEINLDGSKSISNRSLIIKALCKESFVIKNLSTSKDTVTLQALLEKLDASKTKRIKLDAGHAGTTFRFMTAYLAMQKGTQTLTGSERMKQRPIRVLVDALIKLGANIEYLEKEGYPPLKIAAPKKKGLKGNLTIPANISSQYISALLLIAPSLPEGLKLTLDGKIVSIPYIQMTLNLMAHFGIQYTWEENTISIAPQAYQAKFFKVEADWSAASYYYAMAAFSDKLELQLNGLTKESVQGDAIISEMMNQFGIDTSFNSKGIHIHKSKEYSSSRFEWDFIKCPDIAQTLAVICGGTGVQGIFTGLETLKIKETDRIAALQNELAKMQVFFSKIEGDVAPKYTDKDYYMVEGKALMNNPVFPTYEDHRMAMAFAPLAMKGNIQIEEPMVVVKSYPNYWKDLEKLGFVIEEN